MENTVGQVNTKKLPPIIILLTIIVTISPFILNLFGVDFSSSSAVASDQQLHSMGGAFTHTILEWSALMLAFLTCSLAFTNYAIKKDPLAPILGVALLCAGLMDGFHTLAATNLIESVASNKDLVPFTWAICRLFNSLICLLGVSLVLFNKKGTNKKARSFAFIGCVSLIFAAISYLTIHYSATSESLPQTQFPNSLITRPWDIYPLIFFIITSFAYYKYYKKRPSPFAYSLLLSTIPNLATQLHMAFGSSSLFDNHFNIGHFLKIVSYGVPYVGLTWSYFTTNMEKELLNKELVLAKEAAESSERMKSDFLANMSHEIRTPMNGVLGMVNLLRDSKLTPQQTDMLETVRVCGDSLLTLLNEILDLSKIEAGKLELELVEFDIKKCVEGALYLSSHTASQKGVNLLSRIDKDVPQTIIGDVTRIRQILVNFLSNALKFTNEGEVSVIVQSKKIDHENIEIIFQVKDTGIGISQENQKKLFKAFSQADSSTTREFGGTGLGLSICSKLTEAMNGKIELQSAEGEGSNFKVSIPLKAVTTSTLEDEIHEIRGPKKITTDFSKQYPHKILIVEDNLINQKLAVMMLKKFGYECEVASNGLEALKALALVKKHEYNYSLIFMDMQMPEMDGVTATKEIIKKYGENRPKIVAMTANAFKEDKDKCIEAGMDDFTAKPIEIDNLKRVLISYCSSVKKVA